MEQKYLLLYDTVWGHSYGFFETEAEMRAYIGDCELSVREYEMYYIPVAKEITP